MFNSANMATLFSDSDKAPPSFNATTDDFGMWKEKFYIWKQITAIADVKQGAWLVSQLDIDTQDTLLDLISEVDIMKEDGADKVVNILKEICKFKEGYLSKVHEQQGEDHTQCDTSVCCNNETSSTPEFDRDTCLQVPNFNLAKLDDVNMQFTSECNDVSVDIQAGAISMKEVITEC